MKTEKDNNMEDFFKKSLDQFDQVPSGQVWDKINNRLDIDNDQGIGFKQLKKYLFRILPVLALLVLIGFFFYGDDQKTDQYSDNLKQEKLDLDGSEYKEETSTKEITKAAPENTDLKIEKSETETIVSSKEVNITKKTTLSETASEKNTSLNSSKTKIQATLNPNQNNKSNRTLQAQQTAKPTRAAIKKRLNEAYGIVENNSNVQIVKEQNPPSISPIRNRNTTENIKPDNSLAFVSLSPKLKNLDLRLLDDTQELPSTLGNVQLDTINDQEAESNPSRYRIGINARFFNIFLPHSSSFNYSEAYGISQELRLSSSFSLTNSIDFNVQHYDITMMGNTINNDIVGQYTNRSIAQNSITRIESNSEYFDFDLGLKWNTRRTNSKINYFINPSIIWQMYLPQTFVFTHSERGRIYRNDNRVTLYFGSTRLRLGMEYKINKRLHYQFSIWGEQGFTEIGIEKQRFNLIGISNTILFSI